MNDIRTRINKNISFEIFKGYDGKECGTIYVEGAKGICVEISLGKEELDKLETALSARINLTKYTKEGENES